VSLLCILLGSLAALILVPITVIFLQVLMALPARRDPPELQGGKRREVAVLVPAHNEAAGIANTLRSIVPQLRKGDRLLVVADNCNDDTAAIAIASGAEVIVRHDSERRGKGYALNSGVRRLERDPPDVVIVVDADCQIGTEAINRLTIACGESARPVQALNLMRSAEDAGLKTRMAEFAWLVKNQVRPLGYHRLGLPCQLMGTGMAFPWSVISSAALASGHIVEDLMLGIDLTRSGTPPMFCAEALVTSYFPITADGIAQQRTRWEHGHLGMILRDAPRLFLEAIVYRNAKLMALLLDLCVPPLALLMIVVLVLLAFSTALFAATKMALPLWLAAAALTMLASAVLLSWARYGRQTMSLWNLAYAPFYAMWKLPLYLRFLVRRQVEWVRSRRPGD
jgi:cellulose synthase/poly-beta-1,6-N-acetylglucosamine synthase-like glycosyltransferase